MTNLRRVALAIACVALGATHAFAAGKQDEGGEKQLTRAAMPKAVLTAFAATYPKATVKGFASETEDGVLCFEVASVDAGTRRDVLYHADGSVVEVEEAVAIKDLPAPVSAAIAKLAPGGRVTGAEKITRGHATAYEVHLKRGATSSELVLDAAGARVKL